jgi:cyclopropane-fatty-acyl-phospholipid synthase
VDVRDYRELTADNVFDKVVSVGMFEHVGRGQLATYFARAYAATAPGGLFLSRGIVARPDAVAAGPRRWLARLLWRRGGFIDRYVFPDGELVVLNEVVRQAEGAGFEVRAAHTFGEHYARTLRLWLWRLGAARARATALVGEDTYRTWRLYIAASAQAFAAGRLDLAHVVLTRPVEARRLPFVARRARTSD